MAAVAPTGTGVMGPGDHPFVSGTRNKVVAIVDATGAPGLGLVRAILAHRKGGFIPRAITGQLASAQTKALSAAGVQVVTADINDEASLRRAFDGAYAAFYLHAPRQRTVPGRRGLDPVAMAQAAKHAGLKHVVWGILENLDDASAATVPDDDVTPVVAATRAPQKPHRNGNNGADTTRAFTALGVPTTFLQTWWHSAVAAGPLAEQIGRCVYGILRRRELIGKTVSISEDLLAAETAAAYRAPVVTQRWPSTKVMAAALAMTAILLLTATITAWRRRGPELPAEISNGPAESAATSPGPHDPVAIAAAPAKTPVEPVHEPLPAEPPSSEAPARVHRNPSLRARQRHGRSESRAATSSNGAAAPSGQPDPSRPAPSVAPAEPRESPADNPGALALPPQSPPRAQPSTSPIAAGEDSPASRPPANVHPDGFVDPKTVTRMVQSHAAEVRTCFDRALMERPDLRGRLVVRATLDPAGRVISVSPTHTLEGGARLQVCVLSAFQGWTFPPPTGGVKGNITYAFSFE